MGIWAWILLLAISAALATLAQSSVLRGSRKSTDYDWVLIAGGAFLGGFTAHVWYGAAWNMGSVVDGLYVIPALSGAVILGTVVEMIYRVFVRPRQSA
ncbi:MAG TPA: hypothetical protein VGP82_06715 [Ktedonobacterales bacterium]|jgi:hypothetical protein|nr:hypothetical protein [Ktedonobacterales bacterium]